MLDISINSGNQINFNNIEKNKVPQYDNIFEINNEI